MALTLATISEILGLAEGVPEAVLGVVVLEGPAIAPLEAELGGEFFLAFSANCSRACWMALVILTSCLLRLRTSISFGLELEEERLDRAEMSVLTLCEGALDRQSSSPSSLASPSLGPPGTVVNFPSDLLLFQKGFLYNTVSCRSEVLVEKQLQRHLKAIQEQ